MMFRKLYWVVEQLDASGKSRVTGVYTSIPDLIDRGIRRIGADSGDKLRLTLIKLDSNGDALGSWMVDDLPNIGMDLQPYVDTGEISIDERDRLMAITQPA